MASRVGTAIANARQFQQAFQSGPVGLRTRGETAKDPDDSDTSEEPPPQSAKAPVKWGGPIFIHGTLSSVDCSTEPAAVLTVASGSKTLKLKVANRNHLILMGADQFSCSWTKQKVAINYRATEGDSDVISLEIQ